MAKAIVTSSKSLPRMTQEIWCQCQDQGLATLIIGSFLAHGLCLWIRGIRDV